MFLNPYEDKSRYAQKADAYGAKAEGEEIKELKIEDVVTPEHLKIISDASGGFSFAMDPKMSPHETAYTRHDTRVIYLNPLILKGSQKYGIKPWSKNEVLGVTYHEAGHHAPDVVKFQNLLEADLKDPAIVPEAYRGSKESTERFLGAVHRHLDNALADIWLESYMSRRPYYPIREAIAGFNKALGEPATLKMLGKKAVAKPEQLIQALLGSRIWGKERVKEKVDEDVFQSFSHIMESGAMQVTLDRSHFENYFASDNDKEGSIARKFNYYKKVFLPEYLKLVQNELDKRRREKQEEGQGLKKQSDKGEAGKAGKGGAKPGKPQPGESSGGSPDESVPLTKEEEEELIKELLEELAKFGHEPLAHDPDKQKKLKMDIEETARAIQDEKKNGEKGKSADERAGEKKLGEDIIRELGERFQKKDREASERGTAEGAGVSPETVRSWKEIKESYVLEIESLAGTLAEIFVQDRRNRIEYLRREGETTPGLEYEEIAANLSGELEPDTKMIISRNPEFLETELELIGDNSGSMGGEKIKRSIELMVIIIEAFKRIRETLENENLLTGGEDEPLRVGVTKFDVRPERITPLKEPLTDKKELKIIQNLSATGGGTEETGAISQVYKELTLGKKNVLKFMIILTDGQGNREALAPLLRQIEDDDEVIFLAAGLGDDEAGAKEIVRSYLEPLSDRQKNIFGIAASTPGEILPKVTDFIKREVTKRRQF